MKNYFALNTNHNKTVVSFNQLNLGKTIRNVNPSGLLAISMVLILVFICSLSSLAQDYYVDNLNGNDQNDGTFNSPFKTIQKAASKMVAGSTCYIRGGVYRETITPKNSGTNTSPITFMPYNQENVTISGTNEVTGWQAESGNIYWAPINWNMGEGFNQVFVDGVMMNQARWPNAGTDCFTQNSWQFGSANGTSVTFPVSRPQNYWVGGTVYGIFGDRWNAQGATITSSDASGVLTIANKTDIWWSGEGEGFITGLLSELDVAGEWHLANNKLYLWAPNSQNPATLKVEAKARKWCFDLKDKSYIKINNINIKAGSISMNGSNFCEINDCDISYLSHFIKYTWSGWDAAGDIANGNNGIWINGNNNIINNCRIQHSAGSGIAIFGARNVIKNNSISDINYSATYSCPISIKNSSGGNIIYYNTIWNAGRDIIQLYGANNDQIMFNDMSLAGLICHDLGIVYQWGRDGKGTRIGYNWIHDNKGAYRTDRCGPGIYNDNYSKGFINDHNVMWNCEAAVRLNQPNDNILVYNNTAFNCNDFGYNTYNQWPSNVPSFWVYGNISTAILKNNLFLGTSPGKQLQNVSLNNFSLLDRASSIDAGEIIAGFTDGYKGAKPDKGAYESGCITWKPGRGGVGYENNCLFTTSINNDPPISISKLSSDKIYPNPTLGKIFIEDAEGYRISLYNSIGMEVLNAVITNNNYTIDVSFLKNGFYMIQLANKNNPTVTKKIIKR